MLRRGSATTLGLLGAAMAIPASFFAMVLIGSGSFAAVFLRAIPFAPIGAICAVVVGRLRSRTATPQAWRLAFIAVGFVAGGLLGALLDLAISTLRPDIYHGGVSGGDVILGAITGTLAGNLGAIVPKEAT
jgi:hypothetical protein